MTLDDMMQGKIPAHIARDPLALTTLWGQLRSSSPALMADPAAEAEWLSNVENNNYEDDGAEAPSQNPQLLSQRKQSEALLVKISNGEFNGMSDDDHKKYMASLLQMEKQISDDEISQRVKNGLPIFNTRKKGTSLNVPDESQQIE